MAPTRAGSQDALPLVSVYNVFLAILVTSADISGGDYCRPWKLAMSRAYAYLGTS